jgi:IclR family transcriptional regulator, acetate operon repressor
VIDSHPHTVVLRRHPAAEKRAAAAGKDTVIPNLGQARIRAVEREFVVTNGVDARQSMYPLRAVDRVCDILDLLVEHPSGITLSSLATTLALPKSSAFRYLAALEARGYVVRSDDGVGYRLGLQMAAARPTNSDRVERMMAVARPLMVRLTSTDVPVSALVALDGVGIRYLWVSAASTTDPRVPRPDDRAMLHTTAAGKAVAAQLSDDAVLNIVNAAGMPAGTRNSTATLESPTALLRELHRIRGEGFAMGDNELHSDMREVAVPIGGETLALSVAGRGEGFTPDRVAGVVRQLRRASVALARELRG